ncbi:Lipoteichoic acid synthase 1 [Enhygromyxa salina]|uniref:Lipoteichoic acid synthase 1 n=1 Tax=Enhygromyxa salina TaxID=215803 RepID=A0A2S9YG93_9BACT|nr:sulfatase-like hydrolase/transferase [Enhygromyxa salina]PRQ04135.1 Lipoteichoic acid synthase 1 [Enhygromyxa salina]
MTRSRTKTKTTRSREPQLGLLALVVLALALILAPGRVHAGQYGWALDAHETPAQLWVGLDAEVEVTIRNLGAQAWVPRLGDRLSYHWRSESGELLIRDGLRTQLPGIVESGEALTISARVRPPDEPGRYQLEWAMVREQVRWFPPPEGGPVSHAVEVGVGEFAWEPRALELPARLSAGVEAVVEARVLNRGEIPWDPKQGDALAYHWWSDEGELLVGEGQRTSYAEVVEPGAEVGVALRVRPPNNRGPELQRACLELEPVREQVRWYGPPKRPSKLACAWVEPDPIQWDLVEDQTPRALAIDEGEQRVRVVVRNAGSEAWAVEDRLGYRWRPLEGGALIDGPRVELPALVEPGELVELDARVAPPEAPGRYELIWGLVREGQRWYPEPRDRQARREVEVRGPRLAWGLVRGSPPKRVWVNRSERVEVELENLGTQPWSEASGDHLAYHWLDAAGEVVDYDGLRTGFAEPVAPGERVTVSAKIRGPSRPGSYRLQWELVREHERWYGPPAELGRASWSPAALEPVRARWLAAALAVALGLATIGAALVVRLRPPSSARGRAWVEQLPLVWAGLGIWSLTLAFHDLSGIEPWRRASALAASGAWVFVAAPALARGRPRAWLAASLVLGLAALAAADLVYMHYFGSIVPVVALTASHHLGEVSDSALAELEGDWIWLAVVPIAGLIAAALWPPSAKTKAAQPASGPGWRAALARLGSRLRAQLPAVGVCLALASPAMVRLGTALGGSLGTRVFSEQAMVGRFGYLNAHLFDLARTLRERGRRGRPSADELARIHAWFDARALAVAEAEAEAAPEAGPGAEAEGHNLLLIQVEAAQTWVIGLEVEGQEITPLLNQMRAEADWYPHIIDQTSQGKTSDAEYAVLNSQHPLGEGAICFLRADNHFVTLAHVLEERGYATLSAHPYKRGFWNRAVLHPRYGFERSVFRRELGPGQEVGWGLSDGLFFERIMAELEALPQPWFAFLITLSLHHPYDEFPANLDGLELGALEGTRVGNYLEAMHYFDRSLAALLASLDEAGLLDHTVVALYGDHDARFELDAYPEVIELAGARGWDPALFHRLERVPLFVRVPPSARPAFGRVAMTGGHIDIAPTLLHALGVPRPRGFVGQPLIPGMDPAGFAAYPDGSAFGPVSEGQVGRMYVAGGEGIPREGGCFEFPDGGSRPRSECDALAEAAAEQLSISRAVVDHDLHRELHGGPESP